MEFPAATAPVAASPPTAPYATAHATHSVTSNAPYATSAKSPTVADPFATQSHASGPARHHAIAHRRCVGAMSAHGGAPAAVGRTEFSTSRSTRCATPAMAYSPPMRRLNSRSRRDSRGAYPFLSYMASAGSFPLSTLHATATHP